MLGQLSRLKSGTNDDKPGCKCTQAAEVSCVTTFPKTEKQKKA